MTRNRGRGHWGEVERLFHEGRLVPPLGRALFLAGIPDRDLRAEVASLLVAAGQQDPPTIDNAIAEAARAALEDLEPGSRFGHFRIIEAIGRGGMGEVYRAEDVTLGRDVALKLLPAAFAVDDDRLRRFDIEARAVAALNHPNIMAIHEVGSAAGRRFIAAEYVKGETVADMLRSGALSVKEAVRLAVQLADALTAAHENGVIHRDLKPANLKVTPEGTLKVLDFGLARMTRPTEATEHQVRLLERSGATNPGTTIGTAAYMSPEQARGLPVDHRTDIWAFGVVFFEMLTARQLFGRETVTDTLAAVVTEEPDFLQLPPSVRGVIGPCLAKDAGKRWQHIHDVRLTLSRESSEPPSLLRRRSLAAPIGALIAAAAVVAAAFVMRGDREAAPQRLMRFDVNLGADADLANDRGKHTFSVSPDGTRIAFACTASANELRICTRQLDQGSAVALAGTEGVQTIFFSPDGEWIGFSAHGKLKKVSVRGGSPVTLADAPFERGATWTTSGFIVASLDSPSGLVRIPEGGGAPQPLTHFAPGEIRHRWPQFLPGANAVLFTASSEAGNYDNGTLDVVSLVTGEQKTLHRGGYYGRYLASGHLIYMHRATLFAARMDLDRLALTSNAVPVLDDVASRPNDGGADFDFSRTGTFVYQSGDSRRDKTVQWLQKSGRLEPLVAMPGAYDALRLSPDGSRLALVIGNGDVWVYDLKRGTLTRLTFGGANEAPLWSRDGRHLAYTSGQNAGIFWMPADASGDARRLTSIDGTAAYSLSPDGKRLALEVLNSDAQTDILILELENLEAAQPVVHEPTALLRTPASEREPAFSPDGRWLAYVSDESGRNQVYVCSFPGNAGNAAGKWQISTEGGMTPIWSPTRPELFYISGDRRIMVVSYAAEDELFRADKPSRWSDAEIPAGQSIPYITRVIDLAPDGQRFAVLMPSTNAQKPPTHVNVLLNFFDELDRRTAERR